MNYIGRFAPSPTGELHFGSLVAAVGSYLRARECSGAWLVRMEDIDPPREVPGAAQAILSGLAYFGLESDRPVLWQSERLEAYDAALRLLRENGRCYPCGCTRADLPANGVYPGTCRNGLTPLGTERCLRLRLEETRYCFRDGLQGVQEFDLAQISGDFVLRRADGLHAYQLAVVVDDAYQGITEVVRGLDLLDSTPRQIALQQALGHFQPRYLHLPLAVSESRQKLSKQNRARPVCREDPLRVLPEVLRFFGMDMEDRPKSLAEFWRRAEARWCSQRITKRTHVSIDAGWQLGGN